jgi:hypothetical protein
MSTRKLILAALACGLAILVAGTIAILRVPRVDDQDLLLPVGESATAGDMTVTVVDVRQEPDRTLVEVELLGVDGVDGAEGWVLVAAGEKRYPLAEGAEPCGTTSVETALHCQLAFEQSDSGVLAYVHADEQQQWSLAAPSS